MSSREVATMIFNGFTDENTKARLETEAILSNPDSKRFSNFDDVIDDIFSDE